MIQSKPKTRGASRKTYKVTVKVSSKVECEVDASDARQARRAAVSQLQRDERLLELLDFDVCDVEFKENVVNEDPCFSWDEP